MIELTEQQVQMLAHAEPTPPRVVNPRTQETFVLLPVDEYERLKEEEYDDSPWTRGELALHYSRNWARSQRTRNRLGSKCAHLGNKQSFPCYPRCYRVKYP